jgi:hypothetical protein
MKVIIWGYPLGSDTLSYVWNGFYRAFKTMGHEVYWFNDNNYPLEMAFDYSNSLFLCESYQSNKIPIKNDSTYVVHTLCHNPDRFLNDAKRVIDLRYSQDYQDHDTNYKYILDRYKLQNLGPTVYYDPDPTGGYEKIYMGWATDLLPDEIDLEWASLPRSNDLYFVGTIYENDKYSNSQEIEEVKRFCKDRGLNFKHINPWMNPVSDEKNREIIQSSYLAPDIRGPQNVKSGYIPCRLFKNISYGQLGMTNSRALYSLMEDTIVYHPDVYTMLELADKEKDNVKRIQDQMKIVIEKHTYINRVNDLMKIL